VNQDARNGRDAATRLENSALLRVEGFLARRSPGFVILLGLLLLAAIGLIDTVTSAFAVSVFYLVPVGLVTFSRGRWMGALMSGIAAIAWSAAEVANHVTTLESTLPYWNAITRFYAFMAVCLLIAPMRDALVWQRELAAREAETIDQLRAMDELRTALDHGDLPGQDELTALTELRDSLRRLDGPGAATRAT
jgi:K+-sensing histidine kinase KdpD